jgi:hypothetical protein
MPFVRFEPTIPASERAKTVHALDRSATMTGYGALGGMKIDSGNRSTLRKPVPVPLYPPQIPHGLTRARTRTTNHLSYDRSPIEFNEACTAAHLLYSSSVISIYIYVGLSAT